MKNCEVRCLEECRSAFLNRVSHRRRYDYPPRGDFLICQEEYLRSKDQWKIGHRHHVQVLTRGARHVNSRWTLRWQIYVDVVISTLTWDAMKH